MRLSCNCAIIRLHFTTRVKNFAAHASDPSDAVAVAIERLGARKDGIIRGHAMRRDGTIRDTVMYSLRSGEWDEVRAQLLHSLDRPRD